MRYMGGKFRQRRVIADALRPYIDGETTYVEPFLGGGWSFAHVIDTCKPGHAIGADVNGSLIELWRRVVAEGTDWLPTSLEEVEENYAAMRDRDRSGEVDPMLAWYATELSFGGRWFEGVARSDSIRRNGYSTKSTDKKAASMRTCPDLTLMCCSYDELGIPDGAVVYCDPPYQGRYGKLGREFRRGIQFDADSYYDWVRELSQRCVVVCSTYDPPEDFVCVYDWGDTRVTHLNGRDRAERPTTERLIRYEGGLWQCCVALCNTLHATGPQAAVSCVALHCTSLGACNTIQHGSGCNDRRCNMAISYCGFASPCPCGCGWVMCTEYGDWRDEDDCESCSDDTRKEGEEDDGQEEE